MILKTNDGQVVNTKHAMEKHKGRYVRGRIAEVLYYDRNGGYYNIDRMTGSVEWCCDDLALEWFARNGLCDVPERLTRKAG